MFTFSFRKLQLELLNQQKNLYHGAKRLNSNEQKN